MSMNEIVAIAGAAVMGFWMLGAHNRLVRLRRVIADAFAQLDTQFRLRHDLLAELIQAAAVELVETPEAIAAVEAARLQARTAADRAAPQSASADRLAKLGLAEQALRTSLSRLITLVKTRPALRNDPKLRELLKNLSTIQTRLAAARHTFNTAVIDYNRSVQQFPTRLVAAMLGFRAAGELQGPSSSVNRP
jgi:LemA protein